MSWTANSGNDPGVWNQQQQQQQQQQQPWNTPPPPGQPIAWSIVPQILQQHNNNNMHPHPQQGFAHPMQHQNCNQPLYHSLPPLQQSQSFQDQQQLQLPPQPQFLQQPQLSQPPTYYAPLHQLYNRPPPPPPPPPPPRAPLQQQLQQEDMEESEEEDSPQTLNKTPKNSPLQNNVIDLITPPAGEHNTVIDLVAEHSTTVYQEDQNYDSNNFGGLYDDIVVLKKSNSSDSTSGLKTAEQPGDDDDDDDVQEQQDTQTTIQQQTALEEEAPKQKVQNTQNLLSTADRREALLRLKAKLEEARSKRRLTNHTPPTLLQPQPPPLEPITALQTSLVIQNISGPDELVRYHQHQHCHDGNDNSTNDFEAIRQDATEMSSLSFNNKRTNLQKNLQLLKRKLSALKETKNKRIRLEEAQKESQDMTMENSVETTAVKDPLQTVLETNEQVTEAAKAASVVVVPKASKEDLKKRQERLQVKMGIMYWKKLVAKQSNLLHEQELKVKEIQDELCTDKHLIQLQERKLQECDNNITTRGPILERMVASATRQVLETRKALREHMKHHDDNNEDDDDANGL